MSLSTTFRATTFTVLLKTGTLRPWITKLMADLRPIQLHQSAQSISMICERKITHYLQKYSRMFGNSNETIPTARKKGWQSSAEVVHLEDQGVPNSFSLREERKICICFNSQAALKAIYYIRTAGKDVLHCLRVDK